MRSDISPSTHCIACEADLSPASLHQTLQTIRTENAGASSRLMQHVRNIYTVFLSFTWLNHLLSLHIHFHIYFLKPIMQPSAGSVQEQLKEEYLNSTWFRFNVVEPRIGDMDCSALAEDHGPRGQ